MSFSVSGSSIDNKITTDASAVPKNTDTITITFTDANTTQTISTKALLKCSSIILTGNTTASTTYTLTLPSSSDLLGLFNNPAVGNIYDRVVIYNTSTEGSSKYSILKMVVPKVLLLILYYFLD